MIGWKEALVIIAVALIAFLALGAAHKEAARPVGIEWFRENEG